MSDIKISELQSSGSELFEDNENYIQDLTDEEMTDIAGAYGYSNVNVQASIYSNVTIFNNSVFTANGNTINGNSIGNGNTAVG